MSFNKQDFFDAGVRHIVAQGCAAFRVRAENFTISCLYRAPGGARCLIGGLIPDAQYTEKLDTGGGLSAARALELIRFTDFGFDGAHSANCFVNELQRTHDCAAEAHGDNDKLFLAEFERRARYFAESHNLSTEALDAALAAKSGAL